MLGFKLGKKPPEFDEGRTLRLGKYLRRELPPPPAQMDQPNPMPVRWGMMENDKYGDCTCAAAGHAIMSWTQSAKKMISIPTDQEIVSAYSDISGFDPITGEKDEGAVVLHVLKYWRKFGIGGHKIGAFAQIDLNHPREIMQAMYLFGGVYIGVDLPKTSERQIERGEMWHLPEFLAEDDKPGSLGGHAIWIPQMWSPVDLTSITWGGTQRMSWAWWRLYCEEAWAIISEDFLDGTRKTPQGFDIDALRHDLQTIAY